MIPSPRPNSCFGRSPSRPRTGPPAGIVKVASGGIVFTTIQKFQPEEGNVYETLSARENIIVIADEAHRSQYGFKAKTIDTRNHDGVVEGKKIVYGFAKYLRDALPHATYLGFTGTPIESTDVKHLPFSVITWTFMMWHKPWKMVQRSGYIMKAAWLK